MKYESFFSTITESKEWKAWEDYQFVKKRHNPPQAVYNGRITKTHWRDFVKFIKNSTM